MTRAVQFSEVQLLNLSLLLAIQASIRRDPVAACYKFKLCATQAARLVDIPPEKVQAFVANLGHESVFTLRQDLFQLMDAPAGLQRPLATVHVLDPEPPAAPPVDRRVRHERDR